MRNRSQKTAETLLLDPTKNKEKTCKPPGQTQEKGVWDAHAKRQNPSRFCAQAIAKPQPKKCRNVRCWNPLERKDNICPNHAKPQPENCRNVAFGTYEKCRKEKNAETSLLEPIKKRKK